MPNAFPYRSSRDEVALALNRINRAWLDRRPADLVPSFHPGMTMVLPNFSGRIEGRDANVAAFAEFCTQATIQEYREFGHLIDVVGDTAVASFAYEMVYERDSKRYRATGRDLWVFGQHDDRWLAVWRTMLEVDGKPA
jgi:hypothetical protein